MNPVLRYIIAILIALCWFSLNTMGQYYDYYEWGVDNFKKKKYNQSEKYLLKAIEHSKTNDLRAACWLYLTELYKTGKKNDSLYLESKKALVRLGYESPSSETVYIGVDPRSGIPEIPMIDLYPISREIVCELYEAGQYDSAYFYFINYARHYHAKGWCGVGRENDYMYDNIMESRLLASLGNSKESFDILKNYLHPYYDPYNGSPDYYKAIFSFYENVMTLRPQLNKGELLNELEGSLMFVSYKFPLIRFKINYENESVYFMEEWIPRNFEDPVDTNALVDSIFKQTLLYRTIQFKDQLRFDSVVTLRGYIIAGTNYTTFFSFGIPFDLKGWNNNEKPKGDIMLTGRFVGNHVTSTMLWNYDSQLVAPEVYSQKLIQLISYKPYTQ